MAAKRSPILGYNHNVRYRGIVFHVQTEDSGVVNPHVFSHLFHGGVILSTRKYVYDPTATEEAVKSLMQAQHKAVMKELRRGVFDEKIDQYLAGTPGLVPRSEIEGRAGTASDGPELEPADQPIPDPDPAASGAAGAEPSAASTLSGMAVAAPPAPGHAPPAAGHGTSTPALPPTAPSPTAAPPGAPGPAASPAVAAPPVGPPAAPPMMPLVAPPSGPIPSAAPIADLDVAPTIPQPTAPSHPGAVGEVVAAMSTVSLDSGRAPTERYPEHQGPPLPPLPGMPPTPSRTDISAALNAIQVDDDELAAAGLVEITTPPPGASPPEPAPPAFPDVGEVHSPAPPSAATPPGVHPERPGQYMVGRKSGGGDVLRTPTPAARPTPRPPIPRPTPRSSPVTSVPRVGTMPGPLARGNPSRTTPATGHHPPNVPAAGRPAARPPTPAGNRVPSVAPRPAAAATPRAATPRARPPGGGGVVVSRPAVIVGTPTARTTTNTSRVRRARDSEGIGGDLISERSLDEVILAYLSEDNTEE